MKTSALLLVLLLVVVTKSQNCSLPDQSQISPSLMMVLISNGGESSTISVDLQDYHFTCLAVASSDSYRSLSVAVQYTVTNGGTTSAVQYAQFQLECATGSPNFYQLSSTMPFEGGVSPSLLSATTRRDCRLCTGASSGSPSLDTTANCFACSSTCQSMGQGACSDGSTTCCPFFTTDGSCTTACPTNYAASSDTNYTCACAFPCPMGHEPNSACTGCVPVHICVTNNPCQNGATCVIGTNSNTNYTCSCPSNYGGENCTDCVLSCSPGEEANSGCTMCDPVHICLTSNPCQNGATCNIGTNSNTNYTCSCPANFTGQNCEICDLPCPIAGYEPASTCTGICVPVHICLTSNPCQNGATCNIGVTNTDYTCSCVSPFTDKNCSTRGTPCSPNPCQNDGRCSSDGGGYDCTCSNSWRGANCTECGVTNCALCSQSRQGCEMCNIGYDSEQCTAITPAMILTWWQWLLIALGIVFIIFFLILVPVLMVWYCKNRKLDKPEVEKDKELKESTYI